MSDTPALVDDAEIEKLIDQRIEQAVTRLQQQMDQRLTDAIRDVEKRANAHAGGLVDARIAQFESRFESLLDAKFKNLNSTLTHLTESWSDWRKSFDGRITSRDEQMQAHDRALTRLEGDSDFFSKKIVEYDGRIKTLNVTLHGDPDVKAGPPALFEVLSKIAHEVGTIAQNSTIRADAIEQRIDSQTTDIDLLNRWVQDYEAARKRRRERWRNLTTTGVKIGNWFFKTKVGQAVIIGLILSIMTLLAPLAPDMVSRLQSLFR